MRKVASGFRNRNLSSVLDVGPTFLQRVASAVGKSKAISRETVASGGSKSQFNQFISMWAWC